MHTLTLHKLRFREIGLFNFVDCKRETDSAIHIRSMSTQNTHNYDRPYACTPTHSLTTHPYTTHAYTQNGHALYLLRIQLSTFNIEI